MEEERTFIAVGRYLRVQVGLSGLIFINKRIRLNFPARDVIRCQDDSGDSFGAFILCVANVCRMMFVINAY